MGKCLQDKDMQTILSILSIYNDYEIVVPVLHKDKDDL